MIRPLCFSLFCVLSYLWAPSLALSAYKIGIVDVTVLMSESKASLDVTRQLKDARRDIMNTLSDQEAALFALEKEILQERERQGNEAFERKVKLFESERAIYQKRSAHYKRRINESAMQAEKDLMDFIVTVVGKISNEQAYDLVLSKQNVIVGPQSVDLTQDALARLNQELPKLKVNYPLGE